MKEIYQEGRGPDQEEVEDLEINHILKEYQEIDLEANIDIEIKKEDLDIINPDREAKIDQDQNIDIIKFERFICFLLAI